MRVYRAVRKVTGKDITPGKEYIAFHKYINAVSHYSGYDNELSCSYLALACSIQGNTALWYEVTPDFRLGTDGRKTYWFQNALGPHYPYKRIREDRIAPWALEEVIGLTFKVR